MMASTQINRLRKKHVALWTQQQRLRHLQSISVCNVIACSNVTDKEMALRFTMHANVDLPAFYTSETCNDVMNPKWRNLDPSQYPETVNTSIPAIVVRVWCLHESKEHILIEWVLCFNSLQYIGGQIFKNDKKYKPNTVVFRMFEGYYTDPDCLQVINPPVNLEKRRASVYVESHAMRKSYSVSSLQRIHTVQRAVKQTQASILRLRNEINQRLGETQRNKEKHVEKEKLEIMTNILHFEVKTHRLQCTILNDHVNEAVSVLQKKREELAHNRELLQEDKLCLSDNKMMSFAHTRESLLKTNAELALRRKKLISELAFIYPICPVPSKGYTICNVHLPNSEDFPGHDETMIAVALGFVTHMVFMIAEFLDVPLRYPMSHLGSRSRILNHVLDALPDKEREFPLYSKGKEKMQFNYGVYLLNKNLAQLRHYVGYRTEDLRATLLNLKELLDIPLDVQLEQQRSTTSRSFSDTRSIPSSSSNLDHKLAIADVCGLTLDVLSQQQIRRQPLQSSKSSTLPNFRSPVIHCSVGGSNTILRHVNCSSVDRTKGVMCQHPMHLHNDHSVILQNGTVLSCSLDKGLDELQVTGMRSSSVSANPLRSGRSPRLQRAVALHSGSEPNLARHHAMQLVHFHIDSSPSSGEEARPFPLPLDAWATGSSRANSEDDFTAQDDLDASTVTSLQPLAVRRKFGVVCNGPLLPSNRVDETEERCANSNCEIEVFGSF